MKKINTLFFLLLITPIAIFAQDYKHLNVKKKKAVEGYDLVSYFQGTPKEGKSAYASTYKGITYLFSSSANKATFEKSAEKYLPAYGGWCAYAMGANGGKVKIDPETYKIVSGKLYLFYNFYFNNTLDKWNEDEVNLNKKAAINWEKIIN